MTKEKTKRQLIEWGIFIIVLVILFTTGLFREVAGFMQRIVLSTGIIKPDTEEKAGNYATADYDFSFETLDGESVSLQQFKGKVVFINLWATWCPPCIAEMPDIHNLYKDVASDDIEFVMISLDESSKKAAAFIEKKQFSFPVYHLSGNLPQVFYSQSIPTTFVISKQGDVVLKHSGMAKYNNDEFKDFLKNLMDNKKPASL